MSHLTSRRLNSTPETGNRFVGANGAMYIHESPLLKVIFIGLAAVGLFITFLVLKSGGGLQNVVSYIRKKTHMAKGKSPENPKGFKRSATQNAQSPTGYASKYSSPSEGGRGPDRKSVV